MAKKRRYRWQNEKRAVRDQHLRRNDHARAMAEMKARNAARALGVRNPPGTWGSRLRFYELVSLSPLRYAEVPSPARGTIQ
jgi:hypothetical protein